MSQHYHQNQPKFTNSTIWLLLIDQSPSLSFFWHESNVSTDQKQHVSVILGYLTLFAQLFFLEQKGWETIKVLKFCDIIALVLIERHHE